MGHCRPSLFTKLLKETHFRTQQLSKAASSFRLNKPQLHVYLYYSNSICFQTKTKVLSQPNQTNFIYNMYIYIFNPKYFHETPKQTTHYLFLQYFKNCFLLVEPIFGDHKKSPSPNGSTKPTPGTDETKPARLRWRGQWGVATGREGVEAIFLEDVFLGFKDVFSCFFFFLMYVFFQLFFR